MSIIRGWQKETSSLSMTKSFMKEAVFEMLLGELSGNESYFKQKGKYEEQQII